jgi:hypothetical protein
VNFGHEFYDTNDPFPLIYVSTGYAWDGYTGALVYRVVVTTENDTTTYSLSLVQTLKMPNIEGVGVWTEFVIGDDDDCYLCYTASRVIYRMKMPKLSEGDITFDISNALDVYNFTPQPASWDNSSGQGRIYYNGKIVYVSGVPSRSEKRLFVSLDLATRKREVVIDLTTLGLTTEPETVFLWNGKMCIIFISSTSTTNIVALYFE